MKKIIFILQIVNEILRVIFPVLKKRKDEDKQTENNDSINGGK